MPTGKSLSILSIIVYTILAHIGATILKIHWFHVFNGLMLVSILYHILEWKYSWVDEEENIED